MIRGAGPYTLGTSMSPRPSRRQALYLAAGACALGLLGGCSRHRLRVEPPQFQARMAQVAGVDPSNVTLRVELVAYNPNGFELYAREILATLSLQGQQVASANIQLGQVLPPQTPLSGRTSSTRASGAISTRIC